MSSMAGRFPTADAAWTAMTAGRATITLVSTATGARYTYRLETMPKGSPERFGPAARVVLLLTGPNNASDYTRVGHLRTCPGGLVFRPVKGSRMHHDAPPLAAMSWAVRVLQRGGAMPVGLEAYHDGTCCRCRRILTVPSSVSTGVGPECSSKLDK